MVSQYPHVLIFFMSYADGGLSQDTLTGSEDLRALDSDSEFHIPLTTSTPVQRTTSHGRRRDMSSALRLGRLV